MATLPETEDYADGTYQIETSDRVLGGPGGIANKQAEQLGNRTAWLKAAIAKIVNGKTAVGLATQLATARLLKFKGAASGSGNFDGSADTEITLTLADSGVSAGSYTKVTLNAKGVATAGENPRTLEGYGISDAIAIGDYGLGGKVSPQGPIDSKNLLGGFYSFKEGYTTFANYVGLVNIPYGEAGFAGQLGFELGGAEPVVYIRSVSNSGEWTPTRKLWHTGSFDPSTKAPLASPVFTGAPEVPNVAAGDNSKRVANTAFVRAAVSALVGSSPEALDTLNELAAALGNDPNFASTMTKALAGKANKGVSLADYGILDGVKIGRFGIGGTSTDVAPIETIGLPGGFYAMDGSPTAFLQYSSILNLPYSDKSCAGQIAVGQGRDDVIICVRGVTNSGKWTPKRTLWHDGNLDANALLPVGTSIAFAGARAPAGFLKENGAAVSRTVYANLFAVIGTTYGAGDGSTTFNLPESRAEFFRGLDDGRGVDVGRSLGTYQAPMLEAHDHALTSDGTGAAGAAGGNTTADFKVDGSVSVGSTGRTGGAETRPRNVARLMCIKY